MNQQFERIAELEAKLATIEHEQDKLLVRWLSTRAELIDAKYGVEPSGLPNAEARIRELEGKLKIATENCAQAVKERDEAMHVAGVACQDLAETETELEQVTKEYERGKKEAP